MLTARIWRSHLCSTLLGVLSIGMALSACGRADPSTAQDTSALAATAPALAAATQAATVTLDGNIEQMAQESWRVSGTAILLDSRTTISGAPVLGGSVHIRGLLTGNGAVQAQAITVNQIATPAPAAASPTTAPPAAPTATALPPNASVTINGVVQQVNITNNITTIVVNNITYIVPHNVVVILGKQLRAGVPIIFVGQAGTGGQVVVINVTQINNRVIVVNPPRREHDDEDDQGED